MTTIAIVYYSKSGSTEQVAQQIAAGAEQAGSSVISVRVNDQHIQNGRYLNDAIWPQLKQADTIVFGSPTYMGSASAQFKSFMDASSDAYVNQDWNGKIASGFSTGGSLNGEQQQTLLGFFALACQHGMLWSGLDVDQHTSDLGLNRTGSSIGLVASRQNPNSELIDDNDLKTAFYFGQRLARLQVDVSK